jgi:hypothetical protein
MPLIFDTWAMMRSSALPDSATSWTPESTWLDEVEIRL